MRRPDGMSRAQYQAYRKIVAEVLLERSRGRLLDEPEWPSMAAVERMARDIVLKGEGT